MSLSKKLELNQRPEGWAVFEGNEMTDHGVRKLVYAVAFAVGGYVREDYSNRGMFGQTCYGIVCHDSTECIEAAAAKGLTGARVDSMGSSDVIVYWPKIT